MGFVFQSFNLVPVLSALENVQVPLLTLGVGPRRAAAAAAEQLERVGLAGRMWHLPAELSGGEQQRVAIARVLVARPAIVWADEPTGNLDSQTAALVVDLFLEVHRASRAVVLVTHDRQIASVGQRVLEVRDGRIAADGKPQEVLR